MTEGSDPVVSVVIPVWRSEAYVADTLRSVLAQTFTDFEVIIVDDGSPDRSVEICQAIADHRVRFIHQENAGLAAARNAGIRAARGEFIAFLDSDDLWAPEKLARHVAHLRASPTIGVSFSYSTFVDGDGNSVGTYQMFGPPRPTAADCIVRNPIGNGSNAVVRAAVFEGSALPGVGHQRRPCLFDQELRQAEDFEMWTRIAATTDWQFERIPWPLTRYRIRAGGLSTGTSKQKLYHLHALAKIHSFSPHLAARYRTQSVAYMYWYLARILHDQGQSHDARRHIYCAVYYAPRTCRGTQFFLALAVVALSITPSPFYRRFADFYEAMFGRYQEWRMAREQRRDS